MPNFLFNDTLALRKKTGDNRNGTASYAEITNIKGYKTTEEQYKTINGVIVNITKNLIYTTAPVSVGDLIDDKVITRILEVKNFNNSKVAMFRVETEGV